jgi:two-component system chemotaxis sensor kinase CheA
VRPPSNTTQHAAPPLNHVAASAPSHAQAQPPSAMTSDGMLAPVVANAMKAAAADAPARPTAVSDSAIRVDIGLLDKLMNLVGELVLARNQIVQYSASQEDGPFLGTVQRLNQLTTELQTNVMKTRMQPINNVWNRYSRIVRDLAVACKKEVIFKMDGQDTELDKTIIEAIRDPLTHLVRNAIDHGIELPGEREKRGKSREGRLLLHAFQEGGKVIIEIADDGCGIDPRRVRDKAVLAGVITPEQATRLTESELLHLIFVPGFSTAEKVTQFSGRGVGMDVVRNRIENIGGTVSIDSRPGRGTTVKMKIPLTLAIIPALTITSAGERYCIPQVSLQELVRPNTDIEHIHGAPVYRLRGTLLPLVYLDRELRLRQGTNGAASNDINIVVLQADDRQFGLVVDGIHDTEEIVVKPLQKQLKGIGAFAGATIMGDGRVALILDVVGLAQRAHVIAGVRERAMNEKAEESLEDQVERPPLLLVGSHEGERLAIPLAQVARLEEFSRSIIEHMGTSEVVQYRGEILRLVHINRALNQPRRRRNSVKDGARKRAATPAAATPQSDTIQVVVYAGQGLRVGLVVDKILDIVAEPLLAKAPSNRPGVMFSAVVQGRVTEFLDIDSILRAADSHLFRGGNNGLLEGPA